MPCNKIRHLRRSLATTSQQSLSKQCHHILSPLSSWLLSSSVSKSEQFWCSNFCFIGTHDLSISNAFLELFLIVEVLLHFHIIVDLIFCLASHFSRFSDGRYQAFYLSFFGGGGFRVQNNIITQRWH